MMVMMGDQIYECQSREKNVLQTCSVVMEMMVLLLVKDSTNISRVTLCIGCCAYLVPRTKVCFTHTHARFPSVFHLFSYLFFSLALHHESLWRYGRRIGQDSLSQLQSGV